MNHPLAGGVHPGTMNRRQFLAATTLTAAGAAAGLCAPEVPAPRELPEPTAARLPRWRGFNFLEMFNADYHHPFQETDFVWMAEWGFNFTRLPMSYKCWADPQDWRKLKEDELKRVDEAVAFGRKHGVHTCLNLHRAPGYCVNPPAEPLSLWKDEAALDACAFHWGHLARRCQGVPNRHVSFDLLNEPANVSEADYARVVRRLVAAIRAEDSQRFVIADGLQWGTKPVPSLADLGIAQSTRGYVPMPISHYKASWVGGGKWSEPTWPLQPGTPEEWNRERLRRENIVPWQALEKQGVGVHVGEWGCYQYTPHPVALAWMKDNLELWRDAGWGWALWNFRGSFGILDSQRTDVTYEDFRGHKLDRKMLALLQAH